MQKKTLALYCSILCCPTVSFPLVAQETVNIEETKTLFNIPSQNLDEAIIDFSKQSGRAIVVLPKVLKNKTSTAVLGEMSAFEAISIMIQGTDLSIKLGRNNGFIITKLKEKAPEKSRAKRKSEIEPEVVYVFDKDNGKEPAERGIRGATLKSAIIKKQSLGVRDTIVSQGLGNFGASNLAESLQRVPGVTVDRKNNEGDNVTVRGFNSSFNIVTLNGRTMPTASDDRDSAQSRSFNFSELSTEYVKAIDIYKTAKAQNATGGIGATIDVRTYRPFDFEHSNRVITAKIHTDESNVTGEDFTPEIAGIFSEKFANDKMGVLISFSVQERHNRENVLAIDGWLENAGILDEGLLGNIDNSTALINDREFNSWYVPQNYNIGFSDHERTRINGSLVYQYAPNESMKFTADYLTSTYDDDIHRNQLGVWFNSPQLSDINSNGTVTSALQTSGTVDIFGYINEDKTKNDSVGLNLDWQLNEKFNIKFDAHTSESRAAPTLRENGGPTSDQFLILSYDSSHRFSIDNPGELPSLSDIDLGPDGVRGTADDIATVNDDGEVVSNINNPALLSPNLSFWNRNAQSTRIDEVQFDAELEFDNTIDKILFGVGVLRHHTEVDIRVNQQNIGAITAAQLPDAIFSELQIAAEFSDYRGAESLPSIFLFDTEVVIDVLRREIPSFDDLSPLEREFLMDANSQNDPIFIEGLFLDSSPDQLHLLTETTIDAYIAVQGASQYHNMPLKYDIGFKWEHSDVEGESLNPFFVSTEWPTPTEFFPRQSQDDTFSRSTNSYEFFLPNVDLSLEVYPDVFLGMHYSKSISRNDLVAQRATKTLTGDFDVNNATASAGNPGLLPYMSENFDVGIAWYYTDSSFFTIGYFKKNVENFPTLASFESPIDNLRNPLFGPRANQAREDLAILGISEPSVAQIYDQIRINEAIPAGEAIVSNDEDPLINFRITSPVNSQSTKVDGVEMSLQHLFERSGWGLNLNTNFIQAADVFDARISGQQFALAGVGDSASISVFYDKNRIQGRLGYIWRDEFLLGVGQLRSMTEPTFNDSYQQFDLYLGYEISDNILLQFEGLNLTGEDLYQFGRYEEQLIQIVPGDPRYSLGVRVVF